MDLSTLFLFVGPTTMVRASKMNDRIRVWTVYIAGVQRNKHLEPMQMMSHDIDDVGIGDVGVIWKLQN